MCNLIVSGNPENWNGEPWTIEKGRCLREYTADPLEELYSNFYEKTVEELKRVLGEAVHVLTGKPEHRKKAACQWRDGLLIGARTTLRGGGIMRAAYVSIAATIFVGHAQASPVDCDNLKKSRKPYQALISSVATLREFSGSLISEIPNNETYSQYYRNEQGYTIRYNVPVTGDGWSKAVSQHGFIRTLEQRLKTGNQRFLTNLEYSSEISSDYRAQKKDFDIKFRQSAKIGDKTQISDKEEHHKFIGIENIVVGPCIFSGHKYEVSSTSVDNGVRKQFPARIEIYSPELSAMLTTVSAKQEVNHADLTTVITMKSLDTSFQPIPDFN